MQEPAPQNLPKYTYKKKKNNIKPLHILEMFTKVSIVSTF